MKITKQMNGLLYYLMYWEGKNEEYHYNSDEDESEFGVGKPGLYFGDVNLPNGADYYIILGENKKHVAIEIPNVDGRPNYRGFETMVKHMYDLGYSWDDILKFMFESGESYFKL